jgi:hypothetical protein
MLPRKIDDGQSAAIKRRQQLSTLGGIGTGRARTRRNPVLPKILQVLAAA